MARFFVAPNDHAEYDGNVAGSGYTFPLTLACWVYASQDSTPFSQDDSSPTWETYTAQITRSWKYVQVRVVA